MSDFEWRCPMCWWGCDDQGPDDCARCGAPMTRATALEGRLFTLLTIAVPCRVGFKGPRVVLPRGVKQEQPPEPTVAFLKAEHEDLAAQLRAGGVEATWETMRADLATRGPGGGDARWMFMARGMFRTLQQAIEAAEKVGAATVDFDPPHSFAYVDFDVNEAGEYAERFAFGELPPPVLPAA